MAGAGYKLFNTGDVLTAAQVNTYLQEQAVMRFANSTARTTALSGVLAEGMMSYLDDTNTVEVYNGSAWVSVGSTGDITGVTAGTGISGGGSSGDVTITNSMATAIDAKGDLIVGTGADTFSRLAVGTNGHTLVAASGESTGLKWQRSPDFVGCVAYVTNASLSFTANVAKVIDMPNEEIDTDGFHSTSTNTGRITIPSGLGGKYLVMAQFDHDSATNGDYYIGILRKNGNAVAGENRGFCGNVGANRINGATVGFIIDAVATDYFDYTFQVATTSTFNVWLRFSAQYLGA